MGNFKLIKSVTAVALGASVIASALPGVNASAATKYEAKGQTLYTVTTKKDKKVLKKVTSKKYISFGGKVYYQGKLLTGLKSKTYYKNGVKATGTYKKVYYVNGTALTGFNKNSGKFYKGGKLFTGTYNKVKYKNGVNITAQEKAAKAAAKELEQAKKAAATAKAAAAKAKADAAKAKADAAAAALKAKADADEAAAKAKAEADAALAAAEAAADAAKAEYASFKKIVELKTAIAALTIADAANPTEEERAALALVEETIATLTEEEAAKITDADKANLVAVQKVIKEVDAVKEVTTVAAVEGIKVDLNTTAESILAQLPTTLQANAAATEDYTAADVTVNVAWAAAEDFGTTAAKEGKYTFTGTVTLSEADAEKYTLTDAVKTVTVEVTVKEAKVISAVTNPATITVVEGTTPALPAAVKVKFADNTEGEANVTWDESQVDGYKASATAYKITGTVEGTEKTAEVEVKVETQAAFEAAVKAVKTTADKEDEKAFAAALNVAVLNLQNVTTDNVSQYQSAIKNVLGGVSLEQIQTIINDENQKVTEAAAKEEAAKVAAIVNAKNTAELTKALGEAAVQHVGAASEAVTKDATELEKYLAAIKAVAPTTIKAVQEAVDAYNKSIVETAVAKAAVSNTQADYDAAQQLLTTVAAYYKEGTFDVKGTEEGAKTFAERLAAIQTTINANNLTAAINYYAPTKLEVANTVTEAGVSQVTIEVAFAAAKAEAAELVEDYKGDAVITVPKAFAGKEIIVDGHKFEVPAATEGKDTVSFTLSAIKDNEKLDLAAGAAGNFKLVIAVPFADTALPVGQYELKVESIATNDLTGDKKDERILKSVTKTIAVVGNPDIPNAIKAVAAAKEEAEALEALKALAVLDSSVKFEEANVAAYAKAFNALTTAPTTVAEVNAVIEKADAAVKAEKIAEAIKAVAAAKEEAEASEALTALAALDNSVKFEKANVEAYAKAFNALTTAPTTVAEVNAVIKKADAAVAEAKRVAKFNDVLKEEASLLRTAISELASEFALPTYNKLSLNEKLDVAALVKQNAPKKLDESGKETDDFDVKSTEEILALIEAQATAQPTLVKDINEAKDRGELRIALLKLESFSKEDVDVRDVIVDALYAEKAKANSKFPYASLVEIEQEIAKIKDIPTAD